MKTPHEQEWTLDRHMVVNEDGKGICRMQGSGATTEAEALILAAPDMARALLAIRGRVAEAGKSLPRERDADQMAALEDSLVPIPTAMLRDAFAALRKAGVL